MCIRDSLPGFRAEQLDEAPLDFSRGPHEGFQVHSVARGCDVLLHRWKQRAVLEHADTIAFVNSASGESGERLQAVLQWLQLVQLQMQVRRTPPVREHEAQHCDCCAGEHPTDGGNHASIRSTARRCSPDVSNPPRCRRVAQVSFLARRCVVITDLWYKNAIVYSLDLETFMDGNGEGWN